MSHTRVTAEEVLAAVAKLQRELTLRSAHHQCTLQ